MKNIIPPWRLVHARRARALNKRGEDVRFFAKTSSGRATYLYSAPHLIRAKESSK